jgi:hypothetical protein
MMKTKKRLSRRTIGLALLTLGSFSYTAQTHALSLPTGCVQNNPATCSYKSPASFSDRYIDFAIPDANRAGQKLRFRVRYPVGATGPRPVVLWNHGGDVTTLDPTITTPGNEVTAGQQGSERRSKSFARAGYVVINLAREEVSQPTPSDLTICNAMSIQTSSFDGMNACKIALGWHIYGTKNVAQMASLLQQFPRGELPSGILPGFSGTLDLNKIVVGGWAGGTEAVMNIAGAPQSWGGVDNSPKYNFPSLTAPGVMAFFADSPRGQTWALYNDSGFQDDSFYSIDSRPFMFFTGRSDLTPGYSSDGAVLARPTAWFSSMPGNKYLAFTRSPNTDTTGPNHSTMALENNSDEKGCASVVQQQHCDWLESAGVAYLDAVVMKYPAAASWMASDAFSILTGGLVDLNRR